MSGEPRDFRTARGEAGGEPRRASSTGTGHDAPPEPPVAAPDHARADIELLRDAALGWPTPNPYTAACDQLEMTLATLLAERQQDKERIERLTEALTNVGDGELGNVCWCGEEWIGDDYPLDEERQHAEWCEAARAVLAGEGDATPPEAAAGSHD